MLLRTPVTGTVIDVADDQAEKYIGQGFQPVGPKRKAAPKKKAPAKKSKEQ